MHHNEETLLIARDIFTNSVFPLRSNCKLNFEVYSTERLQKEKLETIKLVF